MRQGTVVDANIIAAPTGQCVCSVSERGDPHRPVAKRRQTLNSKVRASESELGRSPTTMARRIGQRLRAWPCWLDTAIWALLVFSRGLPMEPRSAALRNSRDFRT